MQPVNPTQAFNSLIQDISFHSSTFGVVGNSALWVVKVRYLIWSLSERKKEFENANLFELGSGVLLNLLVQNENARMAAKILLLVCRIESCVKEIRWLFDDFEQLWKAFSGENLDEGFVKRIPTDSVPAAIMNRIQRTVKGSKDYVCNVAYRIYAVIRRLDELAMRSIDAHEAITANNAAMITSLVNSSRVVSGIFANTQKIFEVLETRRPMIERTLSLLVGGDPKEKTDQLILAVKNALDSGKSIHQSYQNAVSGFNHELVADFAKRAVFGFGHILNITHMIPDQLKPEPENVVRTRLFAENLERHPPDEAVRDKKWDKKDGTESAS